jgi:uncharacterized protein YukE
MTSLAGYDNTTVKVDPSVLGSAVTVLAGSDPKASGGLLGDISDSLEGIMTTLGDLQLSWVGPSAAEAQAFTDRWNAAMAELFGTKDNPSAGVLVRLVDGLAGAGSNYDGAEDFVAKMFQSFQSSGAGTGSGSGQNANTQSIVNSGGTVTTAVEVRY